MREIKNQLADRIIPKLNVIVIGLAVALVVWGVTIPALAHHGIAGRVSSNFLEGFISGLAHPIIGIDHLTFVIAVGLFSAIITTGIWLPIIFVLMALIGTGIHLMGLNLIFTEPFIAISVLLAGIVLVSRKQPKFWMMVAFTATTGLFHGYAYGESIIGATIVPLTAYLIGFTLIQLCISLISFKVVSIVSKQQFNHSAKILRSVGFVIVGIGIAFLAN